MSRDKRPIAESPWRLEQSPGPDPAHVYAGVRLVAVVYDRDSAAQMVQQHNEQLARKRRA